MIVKTILKKLYYTPVTGSLLRGSMRHLRGKKNLLIAEIGVARGDNSLCMLKSLDIKKLYLIDPYTEYVEDSDGVETVSNIHVKEKDIARDRLNRYGDRVSFIYEPSNVAVKQFKDDFFDFIYIDGNHSLAYEDMTLWYPKVKPGGILAGHDVNHRGVLDSFIRFIDEYDLCDYGISDCVEQRHPDWWLVKK